jgi:serine/threonine-protein kinase RsbW
MGTEVRMMFSYDRVGDPAEQNPVTGTIGDDGRWDSNADPAPPAA